MTHSSEVTCLGTIDLGSEVPGHSQQRILGGVDVTGTSEPQILAPSSAPRSVAPTLEPWISALSSEPWILTPSMDSALSSTSSFMFQRDDATRHTGSDHDRCCGGCALFVEEAKHARDCLPLPSGRGRTNGLSAIALHMCFYFRKCLTARSEPQRQLSNVVKIWMRLRAF